MRPQKQKFAHKPDEGIFGDCFRTAIAAILDLDRDDVPHFNEGALYDDGKQIDRARVWLKGRGLTLISLAYPGETPLDDLMGTIGRLNPGIPFLLAGRSAIGCNHQVVATGNGIACDPSGSGITGPCDDGLYWVDFIGAAITDAPHAEPTAEREWTQDEIDADTDDLEDGPDPGEECGRWRNGKLAQYCTKAGSEECDFECPYRDSECVKC